MPKRHKPSYAGTPPLKAFGARVRALREAKGWSQMELGHRADRHFTFVSNIETGGRNVGLLTVLKLAHALEVDPALLVTVDDRVFQKGLRRAKKSSPS